MPAATPVTVRPADDAGASSRPPLRMALGALFFWLLWGDFCYVIMEAVMPAVLPLKLKHLGASNTLIGLVMTTMPMTLNFVLNPVVSTWSDRHRGLRGRRVPFLLASLAPIALTLLGVGWAPTLGASLHEWSGASGDPRMLILTVLVVMTSLFALFNVVVNSVFWYLFNDVVPERYIGRFMALFRMVGTVSSSLFSFLVFPHAESHAAWIFTGAALLYAVGFGLMCIKVKEGAYPPPPPLGERQSLWAKVAGYGRECHGQAVHRWIFLGAVAWAGGFMAVQPFMVFFYQSTGLSLEQIGTVLGAGSLSTAACIVGAGWLADRHHPVQVVLAGIGLMVLVGLPAQMYWLWADPNPEVSFRLWLVLAIGLNGPAMALAGVWDPPLFMRMFPRERYGQFCSANAMWRSISLIIHGFVLGAFFDWLGQGRSEGDLSAYRWIPVWQWFYAAVILVALLRVRTLWKRAQAGVV
jgi:maltose/moltooligosaccharide transporter